MFYYPPYFLYTYHPSIILIKTIHQNTLNLITVQVGSTHWVEGATCFERISKELIHLIRSKGYSSIEDFKGKLRVYEKHNSKVPQSKSNSSSSSSAAINSNQDRSLKPIVVVVLVVAPFALLLGVLLGFYFHGDVSTLCTEFGKGFVEGYKV